jgi:hypothetical protein
MFTQTSTAPHDAERIRRAVAAEIERAPVLTDPLMGALRNAVVGEPVLARTADDEPAFWLVPIEAGDRACGFARVELSGRVAQVGRFGGGSDDTQSWPKANFFREPPVRFLNEIRAKYPGLRLTKPVLSYDGSPAKWAWRIGIGEPVNSIAYVSTGGWYERPQNTPHDREG